MPPTIGRGTLARPAAPHLCSQPTMDGRECSPQAPRGVAAKAERFLGPALFQPLRISTFTIFFNVLHVFFHARHR